MSAFVKLSIVAFGVLDQPRRACVGPKATDGVATIDLGRDFGQVPDVIFEKELGY